MRVKDAVGQWGEELAVEALVAAGMTVVERNWRVGEGELDIVARDGATLVFCEVKTRSSTMFGDPAEALTQAKIKRIRRLAVLWLAAHPGAADIRFDVISVVRTPSGATRVQHFREAF